MVGVLIVLDTGVSVGVLEGPVLVLLVETVAISTMESMVTRSTPMRADRPASTGVTMIRAAVSPIILLIKKRYHIRIYDQVDIIQAG